MRTGRIRALILFRLASRDLLHGWQTTACLVAAVAVALVPLLILYGLKLGIVTNLIDSLRSDPRVREIRLIRDQSLSAEWMENLRDDPRVGFLLPRARYLASSMRLKGPDARRLLDTRMIPTSSGDPFLLEKEIPYGFHQIALTERVSVQSGAGTGDKVTLSILRIVGESRESERHDVTVVGVVDRDILQTDDVFVSPELEYAIERWREGFPVPQLGWEGAAGRSDTAAVGRQFASFRLFARDVRDVPELRDRLLADGLDVETRSSEIERTLAIEAGLGWVFITVTILSAGGFLLTMGLHLAANVVEKARELSVLRLLGMRSSELSIMPSLQGSMIAAAGAAVACTVAGMAQPIVNATLSGLAGLEGDVSQLNMTDFVIAVLAASVAGSLAGSIAGIRAAALEPAQGLRRE